MNNVVQMPGTRSDAKVRVYFHTEAERAAWGEGYRFAVIAAETAQKQREAVRLEMAREEDGLVDLLELALRALETVKDARPGRAWRFALCRRIRERINAERGRA